ncbi:hypothetical protein ABC255_28735 [Neobacillus sp. 3P2-tot-E-2]|uniref:hypothetical protein n=1 Tax=Neobacillus sp. 3P2-tot-E-2 TaxID=3132212 RepID=UPI0039A01A6F
MLLSDILFNLSGNFITGFVGIAYPVIDLYLLFISILLYYTTRSNNKRTIFTFISICFSFQIVADFIYVHQSFEGTYEFAGWIDPLWTLIKMFRKIKNERIVPTPTVVI